MRKLKRQPQRGNVPGIETIYTLDRVANIVVHTAFKPSPRGQSLRRRCSRTVEGGVGAAAYRLCGVVLQVIEVCPRVPLRLSRRDLLSDRWRQLGLECDDGCSRQLQRLVPLRLRLRQSLQWSLDNTFFAINWNIAADIRGGSPPRAPAMSENQHKE